MAPIIVISNIERRHKSTPKTKKREAIMLTEKQLKTYNLSSLIKVAKSDRKSVV